MPFTSPGTYASQAATGYLATFAIGTLSSPVTFPPLVEVKSFDPDYLNVPQVPTSHLQSPNNTEEFVPGMIKPGVISIAGSFIGDPTQLNLSTLAQNQTVFTWKIIAPMKRGTATYTATGTGYIAKYKPGPFENNKAIDFMGQVQISGNYTETVV